MGIRSGGFLEGGGLPVCFCTGWPIVLMLSSGAIRNEGPACRFDMENRCLDFPSGLF
jgi:hypothetical protein